MHNESHILENNDKTSNGKLYMCIVCLGEHFKDNIQSDHLNTEVHLYYSAAVSVLSFIHQYLQRHL